MQINLKILAIALIGIFSPFDLQAQKLLEDEYKVINDLFISESSMFKFPLYYKLQPDSVFDLIRGEDPKTTNLTASGIDQKEYRCILENFDFGEIRSETIDSIFIQIQKEKLNKGSRVTKKMNKGMLISRPIISGNHAIIYLKTPGRNYQEIYVLANSSKGSWELYGQVFIKIVFNDNLVK